MEKASPSRCLCRLREPLGFARTKMQSTDGEKDPLPGLFDLLGSRPGATNATLAWSSIGIPTKPRRAARYREGNFSGTRQENFIRHFDASGPRRALATRT